MNDDYTNWKRWDSDHFGDCSRSDFRYFNWCISRAKLASKPQQTLEIGFGNGAFLGFCKEQGWPATGIETNKILEDRAHAAGFPAHASLKDMPPGQSFDVIAGFDVLEHLPIDQAEAMLLALRELLSPQGALLLRVPNGDSPFGRANQHGDRTHVETYGLEKLRHLCTSAQLQIVHVGEAPWHSQQGQPRTVRTFLRFALKRVLDRLMGYAYFGQPMDLSPNLFVVLKPIQSRASQA